LAGFQLFIWPDFNFSFGKIMSF